MWAPLKYLLAILGISLLVIVHELGHYLAARAFKMRVLKFSIGLGPALWKYKPKGSPTTFQVCAIPFLAYVQIDGMNPHEEIDPNDPTLYPNKGVVARLITIFAGPFANYLAAMVLGFGLIAIGGMGRVIPHEPMEIGAVSEGSPAAEAGLQQGDVIVEANGRRIRHVDDLIEATRDRAGQATVYRVRRGEEILEPVSITPENREGRGIIGVVAQPGRTVYEPVSLGRAVTEAVLLPIKITAAQLAGLWNALKQRTLEDFHGPKGMTDFVAQQVEEGPRQAILALIFLSVALGMFNLLPFPALDGGRMVFLVYELITRRRANEKVEATVHTFGLLFLLGLLVFITVREVMS